MLLSENIADNGGAISLTGKNRYSLPVITVKETEFFGNMGTSKGSSILLDGVSMVIESSVFLDNKGPSIISASKSQLVLTSTTSQVYQDSSNKSYICIILIENYSSNRLFKFSS